jgi:hypothetical protein
MTAPTSGFALGSISPIWVEDGKYSGFEHPPFITLVGIIGTIAGTPSTENEVIQSGSLPRRQATVTFPWVTDADWATMSGYHETVTPVTWVAPEETLTVIVEELKPSQIAPGLWTVDATLVED